MISEGMPDVRKAEVQWSMSVETKKRWMLMLAESRLAISES